MAKFHSMNLLTISATATPPNTATVRYAQPNRDGSPHTVELKISRLDRKPLAYIITVNGETKISHWQYTGKPCPPAR